MAGERNGDTLRNDAWITVLATSEKHEQQIADAHEPVALGGGRSSDRRWFWTLASFLVFVSGVSGTVVASLLALQRYLPSVNDVQGPDGEPPAILAQPDDSAGFVADYAGRTVEWATSWPVVLALPVAAAALVGLLAGWVRWRLGRSRAAERQVRELEAESSRLTVEAGDQVRRIERMDHDIIDARNQVIDLTDKLTGQDDQANDDAVIAQRILDDLELKSHEADVRAREVIRITADLEDALLERDSLESQVAELEQEMVSSRSSQGESAELTEKLQHAAEFIRGQSRKIDTLEQHLDQVRRRTSEMAGEVRNAEQLRSAWAQAENVIADLSHQLTEAERGRNTYVPQTAEAIVADNSRVFELEKLLNEAADVIESIQNQLRQTRFQLSERDAALARSDVRNEALKTEVALLTQEIDQAAYVIASLQELPSLQRQNESMLLDLREALAAERGRSAELERQLRAVSARALRLEERLLGGTAANRVLDLTDPISTSAA